MVSNRRGRQHVCAITDALSLLREMLSMDIRTQSRRRGFTKSSRIVSISASCRSALAAYRAFESSIVAAACQPAGTVAEWRLCLP